MYRYILSINVFFRKSGKSSLSQYLAFLVRGRSTAGSVQFFPLQQVLRACRMEAHKLPGRHNGVVRTTEGYL